MNIRQRAAWVVAHNKRIWKRLPRTTDLAVTLGYITYDGSPAVGTMHSRSLAVQSKNILE